MPKLNRTREEWKQSLHFTESTAFEALEDIAALFAENEKLQNREQAGRDYLVSICGIGSENPIDFLIAAHAYAMAENAELKKQLNDGHTHDK